MSHISHGAFVNNMIVNTNCKRNVDHHNEEPGTVTSQVVSKRHIVMSGKFIPPAMIRAIAMG